MIENKVNNHPDNTSVKGSGSEGVNNIHGQASPLADHNREVNETEMKILRAAEAEFMQKGFDGARTSSIAATAGVTHAMLHYYFRTKEALFQQIIVMKRNEMLLAVAQPFEEAEEDANIGFVDLICRVVERQLDFFTANPSLPRFMINEMIPYPEKVMEFIAQSLPMVQPLLAKISAKMQKALMKGEIVPVDTYMLFTDIISLNAMSVLASNVMTAFTGKTYDEVIEMRKRENIETIKKRILK